MQGFCVPEPSLCASEEPLATKREGESGEGLQDTGGRGGARGGEKGPPTPRPAEGREAPQDRAGEAAGGEPPSKGCLRPKPFCCLKGHIHHHPLLPPLVPTKGLILHLPSHLQGGEGSPVWLPWRAKGWRLVGPPFNGGHLQPTTH